MRKIVALAIGVLALATTAVAFAVTNTYRVSASTSPTKAGTTKHPVPVKLSFNYQVGEVNNQRPDTVKQYKIHFNGLQVNTAPFKRCTAAQINAEKTDANCPKAALMGNGNIQAMVGITGDNTQTLTHPGANGKNALFCYLKLNFYNAGKNHAALYLRGVQGAADPSKNCAANVSEAIDGSFIRDSKGTTLQFTVPDDLLHPITGFDSAVYNTTSTINRKTAKVKGKTVGFFQSTGGCKSSKRAVTVTFVSEHGQSSRAQGFAKCKK